MRQEKTTLDNLELSIVVAHTMRRFLCHFEIHERTSAIEESLKKLSKFLRSREKKNLKTFVFSTEFERVLWTNATDSYDKHTEIFALDFVVSVYSYYGERVAKLMSISQNLVDRLDVLHSMSDTDSKLAYKIEQNDKDLLSTYVKLLEPYTGIGLRKSLFKEKVLALKELHENS